jgi:hypothetical protein
LVPVARAVLAWYARHGFEQPCELPSRLSLL